MKEFSNVAKRKINAFRGEEGYVSDEMFDDGVLKIKFKNGYCFVDVWGKVDWVKQN